MHEVVDAICRSAGGKRLGGFLMCACVSALCQGGGAGGGGEGGTPSSLVSCQVQSSNTDSCSLGIKRFLHAQAFKGKGRGQHFKIHLHVIFLHFRRVEKTSTVHPVPDSHQLVLPGLNDGLQVAICKVIKCVRD